MINTDPLYQCDESHLVLCPDLYTKLRQEFPGGVLIANQGESMMTSSQRQSDGTSFTSIHHSGEYYRVNCPFCDDTRHRLWVNHMYGQLDANGKAMLFLATCYNENCLSDPVKWKRFYDAIFGYKNYSQRQQATFHVRPGEWIDPQEFGKADPPGEIIPITALARTQPNHPAVVYLMHQRRYTHQILDHYQVGYCYQAAAKYPAAQDRIIFPIVMHGEMVGWQGRYVGDDANWKYTPKYYGLPGMRKRLMLYNYDNAKASPFVVLVEGVTDVHVVGDYSVALLGKRMSRYQYELITSTWVNRPVILVLDPDAQDELRGIVNDLRQNDVVVVPVMLPDGYDCGSFDRATIWSMIYQQTEACGVTLPRR